ncbi:hypothetical protein K440DRAFT_55080 [Wilcoxina mikolae CBS 423.85]|nr:hypothetical protein K440DRAFT_55080 [Wilcoxina mikolae CBS 423.85]
MSGLVVASKNSYKARSSFVRQYACRVCAPHLHGHHLQGGTLGCVSTRRAALIGGWTPKPGRHWPLVAVEWRARISRVGVRGVGIVEPIATHAPSPLALLARPRRPPPRAALPFVARRQWRIKTPPFPPSETLFLFVLHITTELVSHSPSSSPPPQGSRAIVSRLFTPFFQSLALCTKTRCLLLIFPPPKIILPAISKSASQINA